MKHVRAGMIALAFLPAAGGLFAQDPEKPAPVRSPVSPAPPAPQAVPAETRSTPRSETGLVPLRVQVLLSKYDGDKKVSSLPYSFVVNAGDRRGVQLRLGVEVPVPVTTFVSGQALGTMAGAPTSYQYRNVGTNIDCTAETIDQGRYKLVFTVEQSSIQSGERRSAGGGAVQGPVAEAPMFRSYKSSFDAVVRDGQTAQFTAATDPVTGEVNKVDVTVTVVK